MAKSKLLSAMEKRACELYALQGHTKVDAWRIGMKKRIPEDKRDISRNSAYEFFKRPHIMEYVEQVLEHARADDLMRVGRTIRQLEDGIQEAQDKGNVTGFAQLMKLKLTVAGLTRDRLVISTEAGLDDDTLVRALSGGDEKKAALLKSLLGKDGFDKETEH